MLKALEKKLRHFRDERIFKPLARSKYGRRFYPADCHSVILDLGDHLLAINADDRIISSEIRRSGGWFREETSRVINAACASRDVFVDVGANIGTQTIYALLFDGFDRAVCFEPHPKNRMLLELNVKLNGLSDRVTVIGAAAGSAPGVAELGISQTNGGGHSLSGPRDGGSVQVPVVTVESALADLGIDRKQVGLAWIDVEGFEGQVIQGWPSLRGVPTCMEYTPQAANLSANFFHGWTSWAELNSGSIQWKPISEIRLPAKGQMDLLLK